MKKSFFTVDGTRHEDLFTADGYDTETKRKRKRNGNETKTKRKRNGNETETESKWKRKRKRKRNNVNANATAKNVVVYLKTGWGPKYFSVVIIGFQKSKIF